MNETSISNAAKSIKFARARIIERGADSEDEQTIEWNEKRIRRLATMPLTLQLIDKVAALRLEHDALTTAFFELKKREKRPFDNEALSTAINEVFAKRRVVYETLQGLKEQLIDAILSDYAE